MEKIAIFLNLFLWKPATKSLMEPPMTVWTEPKVMFCPETIEFFKDDKRSLQLVINYLFTFCFLPFTSNHFHYYGAELPTNKTMKAKII